MQIVVSELLTTYQEVGTGKCIVLLHGWGDNHKTFSKLTNDLSKKYKVVTLDLPGFGSTEAPETVWGLEDYANFVAKFLSKTKNSPYAFIGHSNGGSVAIKGLASNVLESEKLILLSSAGIRDRQKLRRSVTKFIAKVGKLTTFFLSNKTKNKLRKKLYGAVGSDMLVAPHLQETFKKTVSQDVQVDAKKLKLPTLLIYGSSDKATPPLYGEVYKELINGSKLEVIPDAEHFIHHDNPGRVLELVEDFLK